MIPPPLDRELITDHEMWKMMSRSKARASDVTRLTDEIVLMRERERLFMEIIDGLRKQLENRKEQ